MTASDRAGKAGGPAYRQCAHCRLPLPAHPYWQNAGEQELPFCCTGCVLVFRVIGKAGEGGRADWLLAKLGLATLLSGNVMLFQSLNYFGTLAQLGPEAVRTSSWIMFCCSLVVFALLGVPMLRIAARGLLHGHLRLETLIGFGALAAIGYSAAQTLRGGNHLYYDSGTMVLVFITLGQYLDAEARRRALVLLAPTVGQARRLARLLRDGVELMLSPDEVCADEIVLVRAGEEIPVDGTVLEGSVDVQEPMLTGEWQPRLVAKGDRVNAGSTAVDGALRVRASGSAETLTERIERFALEARDRRAPIEATVDRVIAVFIPAVMLIAISSCLLWGLAGQWERGFLAALAVLVVACPCALGIATPMATTIALTQAIGRGNLVRSGAVLEALSRVRAVAFDKTGTLTTGRPGVMSFVPAANSGAGPAESLLLAASVEREVSHPFARVIVQSVLERGWVLPAASEVSVTAGAGAQGMVRGHRVAVGKPAWLASCGIALTEVTVDNDAVSTVAVAVDGRLAGVLVLEDPPRRESTGALAALRRMGMACQLLSGDREPVVAQVSKAVGGIDYRSDLSPTDKPAALRTLRATHGPVAMVGDGVNDAPALAAADVGIAFGPAADLARVSADVTVLREDLDEVPRLLELARATFRVVRQNLAWAFSYNSIAVVVAALGLLRPVFAAAAMVLSSVCVVGNSMRLGRVAAVATEAQR